MVRLPKTLVIDPSVSGTSGDMLLAALLDLGAAPSVLKDVAESVRRVVPTVKTLDISVNDVVRSGVRAKHVVVNLEEVGVGYVRGSEMISWLDRVASDLGFPDSLRELALNILTTILTAEAKIHGSTPYDVHLHELGSADTILDIVGVVALMEELKLIDAKRYSLPVALGAGTVRIEHGVIPSPAYITLEILTSKGFYVIGGPIDYELTTPTGAAILANIAQPTKFIPLMRVERLGYGAGRAEFKGLPNVVRVMLGTSGDGIPNLRYEEVYVLEANVDDVSGEVLGFVLRKLLNEGALDVSLIPTVSKKSRPAHIVKVLAYEDKVSELVDIMVRDLGTLGVRVLKVGRYAVPVREYKELTLSIGGKSFKVRVKVCRDGSGAVVRIKPEFDDLEVVSNELKMPISEVVRLVDSALRDLHP